MGSGCRDTAAPQSSFAVMRFPPLSSNPTYPHSFSTSGCSAPDRFNQYLSRHTDDGFVERLAAFFFHAAADFHPEKSLPAFTDERLGLMISVCSSTDREVELDFSLAEDPESEDTERDEMTFETSRVVLATSAQTVSRLTGGVTTHFDGEL